MIDRSLPIGRESKKRRQGQNIDALSQEFDLNEQQLNLLRSSGLWSYGDLTKYVNELLTSQYSQEDERAYNESKRDEQREYDEGEVARMRARGQNPDLLGISGSSGDPLTASGSIFPESASLQKVLSGGSLSESFNSVLGNVLRLATFGVNSYGVISNSLMEQGLKIAGLAMSDLPSFAGDAEGKVQDVESVIADAIRSRGFRAGGRKASIYAQTLRRNINSLPSILKRVSDAGSYHKALSDYKLASFQSTDEYTSKITRALELAAETKVKLQEIDFQNAKDKEQFLLDHPNYTAEILDAELRSKVASADASEAQARGQRLDNAGKVIQNEISNEKLKQEQQQTEVGESDKGVRELDNRIKTRTIEGFDMMIEFCRKYEEEQFNFAPNRYSPERRAWNDANKARTEKYVEYRKRLRKAGYFKDKRLHFSGGIKAGPINTGIGN